MDTADIVIAGGGIAGASLAYFLSHRGVNNIILLERESTFGYHSSGRSAAISRAWNEDPVMLAFKRISHAFFRNLPEGFSETPIMDHAGVLDVVAPEDVELIETTVAQSQADGVATEHWDSREVCKRVPVLVPEHVGGGMFYASSGNIAIHELLSAYLKHARAKGVQVRTGAEVTGVDCTAGRVSAVNTTQGSIHTPCLVNAAGAWADSLYALAGGTPLGITPMRRTIIVPPAPDGYQPSVWPHTTDISHHFYIKPEGQSIIASPMDEDPIEPCDARPGDLRVAEIADLLERWTTFSVPHIDHKWAGLRSFAPDKQPVIGDDPHIPGFFWLAGQGGAGISTSPALGQIAAELLVQGDTELIDKRILWPERFSTAAAS